MSSSAATPKGRVPISLLSGFLGSGKTTLLKEVLENKGGLRVGVVVNDVAAINIDAKLVRERSSSGIRTKSGEGVEFVELENGCACCNASDELLACIYQLHEMSLVKGQPFDRIVIEMSGVAEPKNIRREFQEALREKHPIFEHCHLSTMITVVDSPHFFELYSSKNDVADHVELIGYDAAGVERYDELGQVQVERKVVDLLVEQVECADMIVLNKNDRVDDKQRGVLKHIAAALNPSAQVVHCEFGKVELQTIFGVASNVVDMDDDEDIRLSVKAAKIASADACAVPDCADPSHAHGHSHGHEHDHGHTHGTSAAEKYGITTFVYSRSLSKLMAGKLHVSDQGNELSILHSIVRSKGFVWIANHPNSAFHWSQAGAHLALHPLGMWWAATALEVWPDGGDNSSSEVSKVLDEFDLQTRWGDRRQELVFIGIGMVQSDIEALFDACLLTDEEMAQFEEYMVDQPNVVAVKSTDSTPTGRSVHSMA